MCTDLAALAPLRIFLAPLSGCRVHILLKSVVGPIATEYAEKCANPYLAAEHRFVDDVIEPAETRIKLVEGLRLPRTKTMSCPNANMGISR
jgi:acetyl-CoA carboxylase carboxyltransferase component